MSAKETKEPGIVRLDQATLDDKGGQIVAHGWLNLEALQNLRVGDYQREILEVARENHLSGMRLKTMCVCLILCWACVVKSIHLVVAQ